MSFNKLYNQEIPIFGLFGFSFSGGSIVIEAEFFSSEWAIFLFLEYL